MPKKMIIVGAGISGLSTGFYGQLNGFQTKIFEMHSNPGGLCAAWTRKGYKFDISMHLLAGSRNGHYLVYHNCTWSASGLLPTQARSWQQLQAGN